MFGHFPGEVFKYFGLRIDEIEYCKKLLQVSKVEFLYFFIYTVRGSFKEDELMRHLTPLSEEAMMELIMNGNAAVEVEYGKVKIQKLS